MNASKIISIILLLLLRKGETVSGQSCPSKPTAKFSCPVGAATNCIDGDPNTACITEEEPNPFLAIEYSERVTVTSVTLNPPTSSGIHTITLTDTIPRKGEKATGTILGTRTGSDLGPVTISGNSPATGRIVVVQLEDSSPPPPPPPPGSGISPQGHPTIPTILAISDVTVACRGGCPPPAKVKLSSEYWRSELCVDGRLDTMCGVPDRSSDLPGGCSNPLLSLEFGQTVNIKEVQIDRFVGSQILKVRVGDSSSIPEKGELATAGQVLLDETISSDRVRVGTSPVALGPATGSVVLIQAEGDNVRMRLEEVDVICEDEENYEITQIDVMCNKQEVPFCASYYEEGGEFKHENFSIHLLNGEYCLELKRLKIKLCSAVGSTEVFKVRGRQRKLTEDFTFQFVKSPPLPDIFDYYG